MSENKEKQGKLDKADDLVKKGGQVLTAAGVIITLIKALTGKNTPGV